MQEVHDRRFENQDYRAVQLPLMEQPTLHPRLEQWSWTSCARIGAATAAGFTEAHVVEAGKRSAMMPLLVTASGSTAVARAQERG
jgi:hypothetical protein